MRITVASNLTALRHVSAPGFELEVVAFPARSAGLVDRVRGQLRCLQCDYAVVNCSPFELFQLCLLKLFLPFNRCRVVSLDTVLPVPRVAGFRQRAALWLKRKLFTQVALFIEYFRDTAGYERHYGIPRFKFRYVPFKINRYERVLETAVRDDGYIFCGGNTRRDFPTLIAAARQLRYPFKIVTMREAVIGLHGSSLDESNLPANVEVVRHDGSDSFLDFIAAARMVVLPIMKENISASGIGVYLASMALGKCVVISEGPAVNGVVPAGAAVVVPAEDPGALRAAIERAWTDDQFRSATADTGRTYARSLGGEDRLCSSVAQVLLADWTASAREPQAAESASREG